MSTPTKFMLMNETTPLTNDVDEWVQSVVAFMVAKALRDRDGTVTFNITPNRINCEYEPAPAKAEPTT